MTAYMKAVMRITALTITVVVLIAAAIITRRAIPSSPRPVPEFSSPESATTFQVEEVAHGLEVPWAIAFTSPTRLLVTERPGRLRVIENGQLIAAPLKTFSETSTSGEEGLMDIELDPAYAENKQIYLSLAHDQGDNLAVKIVRYKDNGTSLSDETIIIDNIPAARYHAGSRLAFGPDGKLYIATGDAFNKNDAQDITSLAGKILRLNPDGSIPTDNPFPNNPVWSYGHRNPQGLVFAPDGMLYSSEHGPSIIDGPTGGDEVNRIIKGGNYGWPLVSHGKTRAGTESALQVFTPAEAPASLLYYTSSALPMFTDSLLFGALRGEGIVHLARTNNSWQADKLFTNQYGRIRDVAQSPNGDIYFSTSNRDGRGEPQTGDDKIFRITPITQN